MSAAVGSGLADRSGSLVAGRVVRAPPHQGGRSMAETTEAFVGIDVAKLRNAVAVADAGRDGEVRFYGEVDASPESMRRLAAKLAGKHERLHFCYEAGPTGYGLHRLLTGLGHSCVVVAPSLIPRKPGDRVKTNRRDALSLARLLRAGELTPIWVPDTAHEAVRNVRGQKPRASYGKWAEPLRKGHGKTQRFRRSSILLRPRSGDAAPACPGFLTRCQYRPGARPGDHSRQHHRRRSAIFSSS